MPVIDVAAFVGAYPYRRLTHDSPDWLRSQMDRLGIDQAWVSHLPSLLLKDPAPGNEDLLAAVKPYRDRLHPVPILHPAQPRWERDLERALDVEAPAVRLLPQYQGLEPAGSAMRRALAALASSATPVILAVRLEDARQRHPLDVAAEFPAAAVRVLAREVPGAKLIVTHADRGFVEEVHFGLTPAEAARLVWDISGIWGPPEDHLQLLLETVGADRFVLGTGMPLRIPDTPFAKLDLLDAPSAVRASILGRNLERWLTQR